MLWSTLLCMVENTVEVGGYCLSITLLYHRCVLLLVKLWRWCLGGTVHRRGNRPGHEACGGSPFLQSPDVCHALQRFWQWWRIGWSCVWERDRRFHLCLTVLWWWDGYSKWRAPLRWSRWWLCSVCWTSWWGHVWNVCFCCCQRRGWRIGDMNTAWCCGRKSGSR